MPKLDKSQYTKAEWQKIRNERRAAKQRKRVEEQKKQLRTVEFIKPKGVIVPNDGKIGFVLGNGTSRSPINPEDLRTYGKIYGCNALYRTFDPDYLVAVDVKMILEIAKSGYQLEHEVWTNPNKAYYKIKDLNLFHPSKGWSSGPTALWLATQHYYSKIFILGFDYRGLDDGKKFNNVYADTPNYKKSKDGATFFGNWLRQTVSVVKENPNIQYYRVIAPDNYCPEELNKFDNFKTITVEDFQKMFNIS